MEEKINNLVAKHARTYNKSNVMADRKKAKKNGYVKHKGKSYQEESGDTMKEKKGLWANIHAKRKRGEKPARPGDENYPKTLEIESKNTPGDGNPCWDTHKKVGTKMKNGKRVNDCVPKNEKVDNPLADYPEQGKMKVKLVAKEDQVSRDRESEMLKVKHHRERETEKRTTDRMKKRTTKVTSPTRSEQIIAKHEEVVAEQLSALDKRKYSNLKKRAKSGDRTAKKQLDAFEKEKSSEIAMSKGSAGRAKRSTVKSKKGVGDIHTGQGYTGRSSEAGSDDHIIMQLRKAQDVNGNMDIKVSPTGKKVKLPKAMIDKLLKMHDRMSKPDEKRKLRILITKELRKRAK